MNTQKQYSSPVFTAVFPVIIKRRYTHSPIKTIYARRRCLYEGTAEYIQKLVRKAVVVSVDYKNSAYRQQYPVSLSGGEQNYNSIY